MLGKEETGSGRIGYVSLGSPNAETYVSQTDLVCCSRRPSSVAWQTRLQARSFTNKIS